jgi:hypothetical protein
MGCVIVEEEEEEEKKNGIRFSVMYMHWKCDDILSLIPSFRLCISPTHFDGFESLSYISCSFGSATTTGCMPRGP